MTHDPQTQAALQRMQIDLAEAGARIVTLERQVEERETALRVQARYIDQLRTEKRTAEEALRQELARRDAKLVGKINPLTGN